MALRTYLKSAATKGAEAATEARAELARQGTVKLVKAAARRAFIAGFITGGITTLILVAIVSTH